MKGASTTEVPNREWQGLYRVGGVAAIAAGLVFRRNLAVEVGLFAPRPVPAGAGDWFTFLQGNRLLGLIYLHLFDVVNYALLSLVFLALAAALWRTHRSHVVIAAGSSLLATAIYAASNTAFSMLSLSERYAAAAEVDRAALLGAGEALLALNRFTNAGSHPGSGGYASLLLMAVATLVAALAMRRSGAFGRGVAWVGILAGSLDLAYCLVHALFPAVDNALLAVLLIPAAGLLLMVWHLLVGWRLLRLGRA